MQRFSQSALQSLRSLQKNMHGIFTVPTSLTLLRILLVPFVVFALYHHAWWFALSFFIVAVFSDVLDGFFARRWKQQTFLGACLDPIADKLLVITVFFVFMRMGHEWVPVWFFWLVVAKELVQLLGAGLIFLTRRQLSVRPVVLGKISMFAQSCFIFVLLSGYLYPWGELMYELFFVGVSFFLILSLFQYVVEGVRQWVRV